MSLTLTGDFAKLRQWSTKIKAAGGTKALKELSENLAEEALELVAEGFRDEQDPSGERWARKKVPDGRQVLVGKTARLRRGWHRRKVTASGFTIGPAVKYAQYHQSGTQRMTARKMVPDGVKLPSKWRNAFEAIAAEYFRGYFKG